MKQALFVLALLMFLQSFGVAAAATARVFSAPGYPALLLAERQQRQQAQISSQEAAAIVRKRADGRVLSVQRAAAGNRPVYRVKVLTRDGEIRVYQVDAQSGALR